MCLATIKNGFRKTGIYPYNPEAIDKTHPMAILPLLSSAQSQSIEITPHQSSKETTLEVSSNEIIPSNKPFKFPQRSDSTTTDNPSKCPQRIDSTPNDCVAVPSSEIPKKVLNKADSTPEVDFNMLSNANTNSTPRVTENVLANANIVPRHLADISYLPTPKTEKKNKSNVNSKSHHWSRSYCKVKKNRE